MQGELESVDASSAQLEDQLDSALRTGERADVARGLGGGARIAAGAAHPSPGVRPALSGGPVQCAHHRRPSPLARHVLQATSLC